MAVSPINTRQRQILELAERSAEVRVSELANRFGVSEMTIRRDLAGLEKLGKLQRTHGGAALPPVPASPPLRDRMRHMESAKRAMAAAAAPMVDEGRRIFLGPGSTVLSFAHALARGPACRALMTTPETAVALAASGRHDVELTGGRYDPTYRTLVGERVVESVRARLFDIAFVGAFAVDPELGVLDNGELQHLLQPILARQSRRYVVFADHTKIGRPSNYRSLEWLSVDVLVTDRPLISRFAERLAEADVEVIVGADAESQAAARR